MEAQFYELQNISHNIIAKGMCLDAQFQIAFVIEKLPHSFNVLKTLLSY